MRDRVRVRDKDTKTSSLFHLSFFPPEDGPERAIFLRKALGETIRKPPILLLAQAWSWGNRAWKIGLSGVPCLRPPHRGGPRPYPFRALVVVA